MSGQPGRPGAAHSTAFAAAIVEENRHKEKPLAPAYLTPGASVVWYEIMNAVTADHFQAEDHRTLAAFCEACSLYERMSADAEEEAFTILTEQGVKVNPFHTLYRNTASTIQAFAMRLKLAPSARSKDSAGSKAARRMSAAGERSTRAGLMFRGRKPDDGSGE